MLDGHFFLPSNLDQTIPGEVSTLSFPDICPYSTRIFGIPVTFPYTSESSPKSIIMSTNSRSSAGSSDLEHFQPAIDATNFDALAVLATKCRQEQLDDGHCADLQCTIESPPKAGAANAVFTIQFSDGVKWVARVPGRGVTDWGALDAQEMTSDIGIKRLIRSKTEIPIPAVFAWQATRGNPVGVPYTLEAFAEGTALSDVWDDMTENDRLLVLRNVATMMASMQVFRFDGIGTPQTDTNGNTSTAVGPIIVHDVDLKKILRGEQIWGETKAVGPYASTKSQMLQSLDEPDVNHPAHERLRANHKISSLALESIPADLDARGFYLSHPDLDGQNIFVGADRAITALIDWDGAIAQCAALGYARYPVFIIRDWTPGRYDFADSPEQLFWYRQEYARAFGAAAPSALKDLQLSPILEALTIMIADELSGHYTKAQLLNWAFEGLAPFTLSEYFDTFVEGRGESMTEEIRKRFDAMWRHETSPWIFDDTVEDPVGLCGCEVRCDDDRQ